jgi:hypothetical protein
MGPGGQAAAGRLDPGAHSWEPAPAGGSPLDRAAAAVGDLDDHLVVPPADADQGAGRAGMAQDVGQGLLHHRVGRMPTAPIEASSTAATAHVTPREQQWRFER